jgi:hypothetical protein
MRTCCKARIRVARYELILFIVTLAAALGTLLALMGVWGAPQRALIPVISASTWRLSAFWCCWWATSCSAWYRASIGLRKAGARLHLRIVLLFGLATALPTGAGCRARRWWRWSRG